MDANGESKNQLKMISFLFNENYLFHSQSAKHGDLEQVMSGAQVKINGFCGFGEQIFVCLPRSICLLAEFCFYLLENIIYDNNFFFF